MRALLLVLVLASGCGRGSGPTNPNPTPPTGSEPPGGSAACGAPPMGQAMTPDQCTCLGGRVNPSRGGEQEHCAGGESELGTVRLGIEGGWCCKAH